MSSVLELTIAEDWQAVLDALQTNPQGASDRDDWERLPLHYAILTKAPLQVVSALLNAFPEGVKCKDDMYEDTPLDLAEKSDAEPEVVAALAAAAKGVANSSWQPFNLTTSWRRFEALAEVDASRAGHVLHASLVLGETATTYSVDDFALKPSCESWPRPWELHSTLLFPTPSSVPLSGLLSPCVLLSTW